MKFREVVWTPYINKARKKYNLDNFDVYQFEMGMEFYRDARWVKELANRSKGIIAFYHGTDIRNRGVIKQVDDICALRLTSELDLLQLHPQLKYLFLPFDSSKIEQVRSDDKPTVFRIGHAARNRRLKGTEAVIRAIETLQRKGVPVELVLIENKSHEEAMRLKATCHIAVDQLTDLGGWGYGMSSLEFLAMGIPVITKMRKEYCDFLPDHPFENADDNSVEAAIERLVFDVVLRKQRSEQGIAFVKKYHDARVVMRQYYDYLLVEHIASKMPTALEDVAAPPVRL